MKWGIIATGSIAGKFADTVSKMQREDEQIIAVASRDKARAESFAGKYCIPKNYGSYEEMMADPEVEAVYIATPNNLHFENTKMCIDAGKHVLCEKPFTTCAQDACYLYDRAKEKNVFVMEAFWIRFLPLYEKLLDIIRSEKYGRLRHARCDYGFIAKGDRRKRKFLSELGGGALLDIGIYNLGFLYMIMGGLPGSFTSQVRMNEFGTDEYSVIQMVFPGERTAHSIQTIGMKIDRQAALYFDNATIYLPDFQAAFSMKVCPNEGDEYTVECPPAVNGYEYEIREATNCIKGGMVHSRIFRPEDSIAVIGLMDEIRKAWGMKFSFEQ